MLRSLACKRLSGVLGGAPGGATAAAAAAAPAATAAAGAGSRCSSTSASSGSSSSGGGGSRSCLAVQQRRQHEQQQQQTRGFAASAFPEGGVDADTNHEVDIINEKFAEAREEIEFAREDAETVYFNESAEGARAAVRDVLARWDALLGRLPDDEAARLQRGMGLKIQQLKAELQALDELHA